MPYEAILDVGDYKVGDVVPDELALRWLAAYAVPHVKEVVVSKASAPVDAASAPVSKKKR